jgi:hypothetical protein
MRADNTHHVVQAAQRRAQQNRQRAITALRRMDANGQRITFDAVSREAGVSRSWLYSQDDLKAEIERLRGRHPAGQSARVPPAAATGLGLLAAPPPGGGHRPNPGTRGDNQQLRDALARALGERRAAEVLGQTTSPAGNMKLLGPC